MPMYAYFCLECGAEFEKLLRFSEADTLPACPSCQSNQTRKKLAAVASFVSSEGSSSRSSTGNNCSPRGRFR